jgi:6-phosphogluconolactonase (cycloisomerase 2 family)
MSMPPAPTLTSVSVTPASASRALGLTQQYTATANFSDGSTHDVSSSATWTSANAGVASVSSTGLVTTKAVGSTSIQAAFAAFSGSATMDVTPVALVSVAVTLDASRILIGSAHQLTVTGNYSDGSTKDLTASSSFQLTNPYIVNVDSQQRLTATSEGISSITASNSGIASSAIELQSYSKARFAYVPDASRVDAYIVDSASGLLRPTTYVVRDNLQDICATPSLDRGYVVVANFRGFSAGATAAGFLSIYRIDSVTGELTLTADLPQPAAVSGTYGPGCVAFHPSGRFFYVADETSGFVTAYSFDSGTGNATELGSTRAGTTPRNITVDPLGRFLYVSNAGSSDISAFSMDPATGALTNLAGSPIQSFQGQDIVSIDPRGQYAVVAANNTNQMSVYRIGSNGLFTLVSGSNRTVPQGPSRVVFDPTGSFAYFAGFVLSGTVTQNVLEVDSFNAGSGALTKLVTVNLPAGVLNTVAMDPEGKHLYVSDNFGGFYVFPTEGSLIHAPSHFRAAVAINTFSPLAFVGSAAPAIASTAYVYAANPVTGVIAHFNFQADGTFASTLNPTVASGPVSSVTSDFFGRHVFSVAPRSLQPNMFGFIANSQTGNLAPMASPFSLGLQVPELIQVDRGGNFAYATDSFAPEHLWAFEQLGGTFLGFSPPIASMGHTSSIALDPFTGFLIAANRDNNSLSGYELQTTNGAFSSNPFVSNSYPTGAEPAAVYVEPLGRFIYSANQGSNDVSAFSISSAPFDTLNIIGAFQVAASPTSLAADPFGKLLFVGTAGGNIAAYSIDPSTGALTATAPGITASGAVQTMTVDASGSYLIVGTGSGLFVYSFQSDGSLTLVNQTAPTGNFSSITTATSIN